jgi:flavodoxin
MTSLLMPLAASGAAGAAPATGRTLVVWFSRSGNTRVIGGQIARSLQADRFEIAPVRPYPDDYFDTVEQARQERDRGVEPPLAASVERIHSYDTLYFGFPIWGMTAPPVIRSFLSGHDLTGKTIVPFITHGGYGTGDSLEVVARHAPQARLVEGLVMERPQERQTVERVIESLRVAFPAACGEHEERDARIPRPLGWGSFIGWTGWTRAADPEADRPFLIASPWAAVAKTRLLPCPPLRRPNARSRRSNAVGWVRARDLRPLQQKRRPRPSRRSRRGRNRSTCGSSLQPRS